MGFSKSSIEGLVKKVSLKNMMLKLNEILFANRIFEKEEKRMLTPDQNNAFQQIKEKMITTHNVHFITRRHRFR